jgi:hypothetical protein
MQFPTRHFLFQLESVTATVRMFKAERVRSDTPSQMLGKCVCIIFVGHMLISEPGKVMKRMI